MAIDKSLPRSTASVKGPLKRVPRRVTFFDPNTSSNGQKIGGTSATASASSPPKPHVTFSPWSKKLILTLDGGGIRGYSSLIILRALMKEIALVEKRREPEARCSAHSTLISADWIPPEVYKEGEFLPCHYFDYVAGTSFGGLIAIMLGLLEMNIDDCIAEFHRQNKSMPLANNVLNPMADLPLIRRRTTWPTKKSSGFFHAFAQFSAISTARHPTPTLPSSTSGSSSISSSSSAEFRKNSLQCQTLAWCSEVDSRSNEKPYAFCSYEENDEGTELGEEKMVSISEVAKAITAPWSPFFKPFKLGSGQFVDGSRRIRNPTLEVIKEITTLLETGTDTGSDPEPAIDLILSLGTDEHHTWFYERLRGENRDGRVTDKEMGQHKVHYKEYYRLEVPDIRLGFRRKFFLGEIEEATEKWLQGQKNQITKYAEMLVSRRRERTATTRWETFALEARYYCFHEECRERQQAYEDRGVFFDHLDRSHKLTKMASRKEVNIEEELDKGRSFGCGLASS